MRVILVDDDQAMLIIMRRLLSRIVGVTISGSFRRGGDALEWLRSNAADIAFVDIRMDGENGIDLAKRLRAVRRELKVVFVTSHRDYALDAFDLGAFDYIVKPVQSERLEHTLRRFAEERRHAAGTSGDAQPASVGASGNAPQPSAAVPASESVRLTATCLGGLAVYGPSGDVKWRSAKSAELFAYLLLQGEKGASRERILEDLFGGMPIHNANLYLNTAVYQLRSTLKLHGLREAVVSLNDRYKLDPKAVDADFIAFEEGVSAIGTITSSNYKAACELERRYAGDLFSDKAYLWSLTEKERLSFVYNGFSKRLTEWLLNNGHHEMALLVAKKLISRDETDEEAVALLLCAHAAVKDRHALEAQYAAYSAMLKAEFDLAPGIELTRLYERLKADLEGRPPEKT